MVIFLFKHLSLKLSYNPYLFPLYPKRILKTLEGPEATKQALGEHQIFSFALKGVSRALDDLCLIPSGFALGPTVLVALESILLDTLCIR